MDRGDSWDSPSGDGVPIRNGAAPDLRAALDAIMPVLYDELRRMARAYMQQERPDHTLQPTALVHEAYLRLAAQQRVEWTDRTQILGLAARMMRRILADYANGHNAGKRMGKLSRVAFDEIAGGIAAGFRGGVEFMDLNKALTRLEEVDPQMATIVELRFFGGLSIAEVSEATGVSASTVVREWSTARLWLLRQISENGSQ